MDSIDPVEESYAMYKKLWWQCIIMMFGGAAMSLVAGFIILYSIVVTWGLPNMGKEVAPHIQVVQCAAPAQCAGGTLEPYTGSGLAKYAGLCVGDAIEKANGTKITSYPETVSLISSPVGGSIKMTTDRNGNIQTVTVIPEVVKRKTNDGRDIDQPATGIAFQRSETILHEYDVVTATGGVASFIGSLFGAVWGGLFSIPKKVPGVVASILGVQRDSASPMSVIGVSRAGNKLVEMNQWPSFFLLLANLNYLPAALNLMPLSSLDGGHTAVVIYERIRDLIRKVFDKPALRLADYTKLMPITTAFTAILLIFGILVMAADVVNPIALNRWQQAAARQRHRKTKRC